MKNRFKKITVITGCLLLTFCLSACSGNVMYTTPFNPDFEVKELDDSKVAENDNFLLLWDAENARISVTDKKSGTTWCTTPPETASDDKIHPKVNSALLVDYVEKESLVEESGNSYIGAAKYGRTSVEKVKNGIKVVYCFDEEEFSVPVVYKLRDEGVAVTVKTDEITENGNLVYRIAIAPFFCSVKNTATDGYLFYPSGSGALIYPKELVDKELVCSEDVYSKDIANDDSDFSTVTETVKLPVYGAKIGEKAVVGIVEDGAQAATINATVGAQTLGYSAVYPSFTVRGYTLLKAKMFSQGYLVESKKFADKKTNTDFTVAFYFLYGDSANYVGMANRYSKYLIDKKGMTDSCEDSTLNLKIYGGTKITKSFLGIPYSSVEAMTTVERASEIINDISAIYNGKLSVNLVGFGGSGIEPGKISDQLSINKAVGTEKQMDALFSFHNSDNVNLYQDFDAIRFSKTSLKASLTFGSAVATNNESLKFYEPNVATRTSFTAKYRYLARSKLVDFCNDIINKAKKHNRNIGLNTLSNTAYSDYADIKYYVKGCSEEDATEVINKAKSSGLGVAVNSANAYAAALSDMIFDAPLTSSQYDALSVDIPFYEFVFKGNVPIATDNVNMTGDCEKTILKAVECGVGVTFSVIDRFDNTLLQSSSNIFSGSVYKSVFPKVKSFVEKYTNYYAEISGAKIVEHTVISDSVRKTVFDNGVTVYVNYGDSDYNVDGQIVEKNGFIMKR